MEDCNSLDDSDESFGLPCASMTSSTADGNTCTNEAGSLTGTLVDIVTFEFDASPQPSKQLAAETKGVSEYQTEILLLLLLRLRHQEGEQKVKVELDPRTSVLVVDLQSTSINKQILHYRVHVNAGGKDDVTTPCLKSFHISGSNRDSATCIEFTNYDVASLDNLLETSGEKNPLGLRLLRFKPTFKGCQQLASLFAADERHEKLAYQFLTRVRLTSNQPNCENVTAACKNELHTELHNQQVDTLHMKLIAWIKDWIQDALTSEKPTFLTKNDIIKNVSELKYKLRLNYGVYNPVLNYIGREREFTILRYILQQNKTEIIDVVVTGEAGIGKTEIVRRYLLLYGRLWDRIIILSAETKSSLLDSLSKVARLYGLEEQDNEHDQVSIYMKQLYAFMIGYKWLLVFENVDSIESIASLLPDNKEDAPKIIVTSHSPDWNVKNVVKLPSLYPHEACALLQGTLRTYDVTLLDKLGSAMAYHPFALQVVSSSCVTNGKFYKELGKIGQLGIEVVQVIKKVKSELDDGLEPYKAAWNAAWESTQRLLLREKYGNIALQILNIIALFDLENNIEIKLFFLLPDILELDIDSRENILNGVISMLQLLCLIQVVDGIIFIQRVLHTQLRNMLNCNMEHKKNTVDIVLSMAARDLVENRDNPDSSITNFKPSFISLWINTYRIALHYEDLLVKHSRILHKLLYDVFRHKSNTQIHSTLNLMNEIIKILDSSDVKNCITFNSINLIRLEISKEICLYNINSKLKNQLKHLVDKYQDDAVVLLSLLK